MGSLDKSTPTAARGAGRVLQIIFAAWLLFVNALYYAQFRSLAASLLSRIHLWR
jgi:hypothetical protein